MELKFSARYVTEHKSTYTVTFSVPEFYFGADILEMAKMELERVHKDIYGTPVLESIIIVDEIFETSDEAESSSKSDKESTRKELAERFAHSFIATGAYLSTAAGLNTYLLANEVTDFTDNFLKKLGDGTKE